MLPIGKDAKDAIPVFITILKKEPLNEDDNIKLLKKNILGYLGNIGQDARNTVPVLIEKLTEQLIPNHKREATDSYRKAEPKDNPNLQDENIICRPT